MSKKKNKTGSFQSSMSLESYVCKLKRYFDGHSDWDDSLTEMIIRLAQHFIQNDISPKMTFCPKRHFVQNTNFVRNDISTKRTFCPKRHFAQKDISPKTTFRPKWHFAQNDISPKTTFRLKRHFAPNDISHRTTFCPKRHFVQKRHFAKTTIRQIWRWDFKLNVMQLRLKFLIFFYLTHTLTHSLTSQTKIMTLHFCNSRLKQGWKMSFSFGAL